MIDSKVVRLQYVERILAAMDSEFALGEDGSLWVNDGQYQILLPDQSPSEVLIRFSKKFHPAAATNIGTRFSGVAKSDGLRCQIHRNF